MDFVLNFGMHTDFPPSTMSCQTHINPIQARNYKLGSWSFVQTYEFTPYPLILCECQTNELCCWDQFHQNFMSFYVRRSQKRKKDTQLKQLFALSGSACVKAVSKHVGEIDDWSKSHAGYCIPLIIHTLLNHSAEKTNKTKIKG